MHPRVLAAGDSLAWLTWISTQHAGSVPPGGAAFVPDDWVREVEGRAAIGRTSASILAPLGLEELVASSAADYAQKALALASDPPRLSTLRRAIPQSLARSALLDAPAYAAALEAALHDLWQRHA